MTADAQAAPMHAEREWWLRLALVLTAPASVFAWVRDDSAEAAAARQEPLTALAFLSGIAIFLITRTAARLFDSTFVTPSGALVTTWHVDVVLLLVETPVAGLLIAIQNCWIIGGAAYLGGRAADSGATWRQARHVLALATAPFVLELLLVWPVRLAMFGTASFHSGGADHGPAEDVFRALDAGFLVWTLALIVIGVRTLNGWRWPRTFASLGIAAVLLALITVLFVGIPV